MDVTGYINDKKSGNNVQAKIFMTVNGANLFDPFYTDAQGVFYINDVPDNATLKIEAMGYDTQVWQASELSNGNNIFLLDHKSNLLPIVGLGAAAYMLASKNKKNVGAIEKKDIELVAIAGGGLIAFGLLQKLLTTLGIWQSKDTKDLNTTSTDPGSWWNPNYWKQFTSYQYAITQSVAEAWAKEIYDAFGAFNDCEECAITVFKRCQTKAAASFLCWAFQNVYGQDLLTFLRGGWWPQDRLSDADVNTINQFINKLPTN